MHSKRSHPAWWCSLTWLFGSVVSLWLSTPALGSASPHQLHTLVKLPASDGHALIHRFRLPLAGLQASVVDLGYRRPLADALGDAELVVNGGYWGWIDERRRTLLGLLVVGGKLLSPLREGLDGGVLTLHHGRARIASSRGYVVPKHAELALQCRPRLIVSRSVSPGLNAERRSARTAACVRDAGRTLDIYLTDPEGPGASLAELARWLLREGCDHALNLDGGPSSAAAFWERGAVVSLGKGEKLPYALQFRY